MKLKITTLSLCFCVLSLFSNAQEATAPPASGSTSTSSNYGLPKQQDFDQWSIGVFGGLNFFQGDLQTSNNNSDIWDNVKDPVLGIKIGYQLTHSFQLNLRGSYCTLSGEEDKIRMRFPDPVDGTEYSVVNASFETPVMQGSLNLNYTLGNISFVQRNKKLHLYGEMGLGIFSFSPEVKGTIVEISPKPDSLLMDRSGITEAYGVAGVGLKYQLGRFDLNLMYSYHKTLTDKIDWAYDSKTETDNYSFFTLGLNYTLGKKQNMMEWVNPMEVVYNDMAELKDKMDILSGDKDKDGVSDMFDKDNSTAEGTKVYGDGTMVDTDSDGVPDGKDSDPFSQKGAKVDANGVESDSDGDGVPDSRDLEPNTAKGSLTNFQGIAIDKSLEEKGSSASSRGIGWLPPIFFDLNGSEVSSTQKDRALIVAKVLMANPNLKLNIVGNCDVSGGEDFNRKLGQRRADAVKNHLVKHYGIDASRLNATSKGKNEPVAKGINAMNRRVDFEVTK